MIKAAVKDINRALRSGRLRGPDVSCEYYPCHFPGQDCTWCFCPFYPCGDPSAGGKTKRLGGTRRLVWDCSRCSWIHEPKVAMEVLKGVLTLGSDVRRIPRKALLELYSEIRYQRAEAR
ncbi:TPA: hypothetical protein EYP26_03995 [Candidatus Bathyarchaeota archaeon]|nr:hypothetical protein [Candidatus Bathyarchaeota archaeon]